MKKDILHCILKQWIFGGGLSGKRWGRANSGGRMAGISDALRNPGCGMRGAGCGTQTVVCFGNFHNNRNAACDNAGYVRLCRWDRLADEKTGLIEMGGLPRLEFVMTQTVAKPISR